MNGFGDLEMIINMNFTYNYTFCDDIIEEWIFLFITWVGSGVSWSRSVGLAHAVVSWADWLTARLGQRGGGWQARPLEWEHSRPFPVK